MRPCGPCPPAGPGTFRPKVLANSPRICYTGTAAEKNGRRGGARLAQMDAKLDAPPAGDMAGAVPHPYPAPLLRPRRGAAGRGIGLLPAFHPVPLPHLPEQPAGPSGPGHLRHHGKPLPPPSGERAGAHRDLPHLRRPDLQSGHALVRPGVHHLVPHAGGGLPDARRAPGLPPGPKTSWPTTSRSCSTPSSSS